MKGQRIEAAREEMYVRGSPRSSSSNEVAGASEPVARLLGGAVLVRSIPGAGSPLPLGISVSAGAGSSA